MKGFNTSLDYSKLWDFIHNDFRIPAWILQSEILGNPIFDLVEVRMLKYRDYPIIGTRGISYSTMENTKEAFINNCKSLQMVFIIPNEEQKKCYCGHTSYCDCGPQEPKQETLEEVAERLYPLRNTFLERFKDLEQKIFIEGAKWQQEQDKKLYSEEEMLKMLHKFGFDYTYNYKGEKTIYEWIPEWFEEYKRLLTI